MVSGAFIWTNIVWRPTSVLDFLDTYLIMNKEKLAQKVIVILDFEGDFLMRLLKRQMTSSSRQSKHAGTEFREVFSFNGLIGDQELISF